MNCMLIENAYRGSAFGTNYKPYGRVDQLEERYLGMVEAPSSNLGTSTIFDEAIRIVDVLRIINSFTNDMIIPHIISHNEKKAFVGVIINQ